MCVDRYTLAYICLLSPDHPSVATQSDQPLLYHVLQLVQAGRGKWFRLRGSLRDPRAAQVAALTPGHHDLMMFNDHIIARIGTLYSIAAASAQARAIMSATPTNVPFMLADTGHFRTLEREQNAASMTDPAHAQLRVEPPAASDDSNKPGPSAAKMLADEDAHMRAEEDAQRALDALALTQLMPQQTACQRLDYARSLLNVELVRQGQPTA